MHAASSRPPVPVAGALPATGATSRIAIAALSLSASALVGIAGWEQYRGEAYLPTPQDVPTLGWGSTDGVKLGARNYGRDRRYPITNHYADEW